MSHDEGMVAEDAPAERWAFTLVEPLISTAERHELDKAMVVAIANRPTWGCAWFGGTISDMMVTLPRRDPWRNLSATIEGPKDQVLHCGDTPPEHTGASMDDKPFGTYEDADDLSEAIFEDPTIDIATIALANPLEPLSAALLAFASGGWERSIEACEAAWSSLAPTPVGLLMLSETERNAATLRAAGSFFTAAAQALRWAIHRRRSYGIIEDPWPIESAWNWTIRAHKIANGQPWATSDLELSLNQERLDDVAVERSTSH